MEAAGRRGAVRVRGRVSFALRFLRWPVGRRWWGRSGGGVEGMGADLSVCTARYRDGDLVETYVEQIGDGAEGS